MHGPLNVKFIY